MLKHFTGLNKVLDSRFRLGILILTVEHEETGFTFLKKELGLSDGNLASHLKILEKNDYIGLKKKFIGRKPNTSYYMTLKGQEAFEDHIKNLKKLIGPLK